MVASLRGACALAFVAALSACSDDASAPPPASTPALLDTPPTTPLPSLPPLSEAARGVGTMTARIPGTTLEASGVRLVSHRARATVRDGLAHTEIEETFRNDGDRVLEGRFAFPLPAGATISRLALWVGSVLVEGEIVERGRADRIFRGIVDDTVRPRDPALLELGAGGRLSLRVFPIPPRGERTVIVGYDQALPREGAGVRYVLPLFGGPLASSRIARASFALNGVSHLDATDYLPAGDLTVVIDEPPPAILRARDAQGGFALVRQTLAGGAERPPGDVVVALDTSEAQTREALVAELHLADAIVAGLAEGERFAILACDAGCVSYPESGLAAPSPDTLAGARRFLLARDAGGSFDLAGALLSADARLDPSLGGQIVLATGGTATAGELSATTIAARVAPVLARRSTRDVRLVGVGPAVDEGALSTLARALPAMFDRLATGAPIAERVAFLARSRRTTVIASPQIELPAGLVDPVPREPPPMRAGEELVLTARVASFEATVASDATSAALLGRAWARGRIDELDSSGGAGPEIVALSKGHHVLSPLTSLLVLENERMFAEHGIPRTSPALAFGDAPSVDSTAVSPTAERGGGHIVRAPQLRMGSSSVSGRLPAEIVQRVVRQRFGRYRACYVDGLRRDPALAGRVAVSFVIGREGAVAAAVDGGSDLPDAAVIACVVDAFRGLSFPAPESGVITVNYPLLFAPEASRGDADRAPPPHPLPVPLRLGHGSIDAAPPFVEPPLAAPEPPLVPATAEHRAGDDRWLASDIAPPPAGSTSASRTARDREVRRAIARGRFEDAYREASRAVALDPAHPWPREALADAAALVGRKDEAARALDTAAALDPRSVPRRLAAARAFMSAGDSTRACAHLRTLGELAPDRHAARAAACRDEGAASLPPPPAAPASFEVATEDEKSARRVAVVTPSGRVYSEWTAGPGLRFAALESGTYRTLLVDPTDRVPSLRVRTLGATFEAREPAARTLVATTVRLPPPRPIRYRPVVRW